MITIPWLGKGRRQSGLAGVAIHADGVALAQVQREKGRKPELKVCEFVECTDTQELRKILRDLVRRHELEHSVLSTVMAPRDYSLLQVEAPDVPAEELRAAVRWRIKDLIDFHIDDAAIDVFELAGPERGGSRMMYAVAARASAIQDRVDLVSDSGMELDVIDITELTLRNVSALLPADVDGLATLYLDRDSGLIVLTQQTSLYLARSINIGMDRLRDAAGIGESGDQGHPGTELVRLYDRINLELRRSLDYYERQFGMPPIRHLAVAPLEQALPNLNEYLAAELDIEVSNIDLNDCMDSPDVLPASVQARCLGAVGAALRVEERVL